VLLCGLFLGAGLYVIPQYLRILQPYNAQQTAVFCLVDTVGMFLGVSFAVWIGVPRFGGAKTAGLGIILFGIANAIFVLIWTDMTPGNDIAYVLFLLGIGSDLLLAGISLLSTGTLEKRFQNEAASSYFFLPASRRQPGGIGSRGLDRPEDDRAFLAPAGYCKPP
jgi:hypothetical protein